MCIAVSARITHINDSDVQNQNNLVKELFNQFDNSDKVTLNNNYYTLTESSVLNTTLYSQFGAQLDIGEIDRNIAQLIANKKGWLESHDEFEFHEKSIDDLKPVVNFLLNDNAIKAFNKLLSNINEIVRQDNTFTKISKIDVQIYEEKRDSKIVVIHASFSIHIRKIKMHFNMRKIGIGEQE